MSELSESLAQKNAVIEKILKDNGAEDIVKIDLKDRSALFDFIYISTALSQTHLVAISEKIAQALKDIDGHYIPHEGEGTQWGVVDGGDMVIHLLTQEARDRYKLEDIWSDDFDALGERPVVSL